MDQQEAHSMGRKLTRRCLLGVSGGMALLISSQPSGAQRLIMHAVTERRETMDIKRNGSRPSTKGPAAYFTGAVRVDPVFRIAPVETALRSCTAGLNAYAYS
jgi:hypothetical protein